MYYPLSTGGSVRFGGLREKRQMAFESGSPWFPGDFPGTAAGDEWEAQELMKRKAEWERKPKGRRTEFDSVDLGMERKGEIGMGWACDWQMLVGAKPEAEAESPAMLVSTPRSIAILALKSQTVDKLPTNALMTVKITMVTRGVPQTCARIYRLPTNNEELREKWLAQVPTSASKKSNPKKAPFPKRPNVEVSSAMHRSYVAASILATPSQPGNVDYPNVPDEDDLIGFVTTGNFNLGEGKGIGIGSLLLTKVVPGLGASLNEDNDTLMLSTYEKGPENDKSKKSKEERLCIVRDAGQAVGRLARWELA